METSEKSVYTLSPILPALLSRSEELGAQRIERRGEGAFLISSHTVALFLETRTIFFLPPNQNHELDEAAGLPLR